MRIIYRRQRIKLHHLEAGPSGHDPALLLIGCPLAPLAAPIDAEAPDAPPAAERAEKGVVVARRILGAAAATVAAAVVTGGSGGGS